VALTEHWTFNTFKLSRAVNNDDLYYKFIGLSDCQTKLGTTDETRDRVNLKFIHQLV
jgi:hypothetical protein